VDVTGTTKILVPEHGDGVLHAKGLSTLNASSDHVVRVAQSPPHGSRSAPQRELPHRCRHLLVELPVVVIDVVEDSGATADEQDNPGRDESNRQKSLPVRPAHRPNLSQRTQEVLNVPLPRLPQGGSRAAQDVLRMVARTLHRRRVRRDGSCDLGAPRHLEPRDARISPELHGLVHPQCCNGLPRNAKPPSMPGMDVRETKGRSEEVAPP